MLLDSQVQPCPKCTRSTVLGTFSWGRQWIHTGTWSLECGPPAWSDDDAPNATVSHPQTGLTAPQQRMASSSPEVSAGY